MKRFLLSLAIAASVSGCAMQQSFSAGDYELTPKAMSLLASDFIPPLKREIPRSHQLELVEVSPEFTPLLESQLRKAGYAVTVVKRPNKQSPARSVRYSLSPFDGPTVWAVMSVDKAFSVARVYTMQGGTLRAAAPETIRYPEAGQ